VCVGLADCRYDFPDAGNLSVVLGLAYTVSHRCRYFSTNDMDRDVYLDVCRLGV